VRKILQQSLLQKRCKVSSEQLCSPEVGGNGETPREDVQKQLEVLHRCFIAKQQSCNDRDNTQSLSGRRRNAPIHRYMSTGTNKKMKAILRANLKANVSTSMVI